MADDPMAKCFLHRTLQARQFLNKFMPSGRGIEAPKIRFSPVPCDASNASEICTPLVQCIKDSRICPGYQIIDASDACLLSNADDEDYSRLFLYPTGLDFWQNSADAWRSLEMPIHVLAPSADDLFGYGDECSEVLESIIEQVAEQFAHQHRTHVFSLIIFGRYARFLRWDRAGCVVSKGFEYHKNPRLLADFFWRFTFLSRAERGFDPTTTDATPSEIRAFKATVRNFIKNAPRNAEFLRPTLDDDYPVYKMQLDSVNGQKMHLIIGKPFHGYKRPTCGGRATRVYAAYLKSEKRLVCLKDFWRSHQLVSEAEMYQHLANHDVPHLPTNLAAGDVLVDSQLQSTSNQQHGRLWGLTHQRIVQEIAFPLETAKSSRELTQVFRDIIACMSKAWQSANVLHQDLSDGNIMITQEGRGILNDWDCGWEKTAEDPKNENRVGTWRFMSVLLCKNPFKEHEIHDDLESCFWVLLWIAVRYVKCVKLWDSFSWHIFDECGLEAFQDPNYPQNDMGVQFAVGGMEKKQFVTYMSSMKLEWRCKPFNKLMDEFKHIFGQFHRGVEDNVVKLFDDALAEEGWLDNDTVPNMFPYKTEEEWEVYALKCRRRNLISKRQKAQERQAAKERAAGQGLPYVEPAIDAHPEAQAVTKYPYVFPPDSDDEEPTKPVRRSARIKKVARVIPPNRQVDRSPKRKRAEEDKHASDGEVGPQMIKKRKPEEEGKSDSGSSSDSLRHILRIFGRRPKGALV
ncbi:unnamed protein product [Somion occarium]|uniref:Fungal-type protein kinase domain-containing protein n=1 Tax=Somion occarium TaxID=3059160 RepID=A0ABP1CQ03_9APHY